MNTAILVAYSLNRVIGAQGVIPWNLPSERNRFKEICKNKKVIMGRKTFEEIGKPLSYCTIVIVSSSMKTAPEGCLLAKTFKQAINLCRQNADADTEILIAGGQEIYTQALPLCSKIYATEIQMNIEGDRFFPTLPQEENWQKTVEMEKEENGIKYQYVTWQRKGNLL